MQSVQYTERVPVYSNKGELITSSVLQHTQQPVSHPPTKQILLDTRDDKVRISYQQPTLDKEAHMQPSLSYEKKGDEILDTRAQPAAAVVQGMQKPLPSIPVVQNNSELMPRAVSETEPKYVTVYEDGAHPFSPRTVNLLGSAARQPPPPPPSTEPTTPTETMQYTETTVTKTTITTQPIQSSVNNQPTQDTVMPRTTQPPAAVAVPSWPPTDAEHNVAVAKRVVEASTVREESPLMAGVAHTSSPLLVSAGPQPYELVHPKNAIDVVQLPPAQPKLPLHAVETVENNTAPLPLAPPTEVVAAAKRALVARPLPAPVASKPVVPALPPPTTTTTQQPTTTQGPLPVPVLPPTRYEQAQPKTTAPIPLPAPKPVTPAPTVRHVSAVPQPQAQRVKAWKMPRLFDVLLSPWAIGLYLLLAGLSLLWLPFWMLVGLAVALDIAVIGYIKSRPASQPAPSTALVRYHAPAPLPLPAPVISTTAIPALLPPAPETMATALVVVPQQSASQHSAPQPHHARSKSRDAATQTEVGEEEQEESVPVPKSPAQFFAALRQQHGGSPPSSGSPVSDRASRFVQMKKLAPSSKQQAAQPLLSDAQSIAPAGLHMVDIHQHTTTTTATSSEVSAPQRYSQTASSVQVGTVLPSPSKLPNPMLDALNSASPRRELKELSEAVETYHDMQPTGTMPLQVEAAARRAVATIPTTNTGTAVQGASNPAVMVPSWPPSEQQHAVAQARHLVEASTVRDHSVLLDDEMTVTQSQPYEVVPPTHHNRAPSFHVAASDVTPAATSVTQQRVVQTTTATALPLSTQSLVAEEYAVKAVKQVTSEERKEEVVVADVGEVDRVSDVGSGIGSDGGLRLRNIASHVHSQ